MKQQAFNPYLPSWEYVPDGPFTYGGVLVDLGDLYRDGNTDEAHANNYLGNTHGVFCV